MFLGSFWTLQLRGWTFNPNDKGVVEGTYDFLEPTCLLFLH